MLFRSVNLSLGSADPSRSSILVSGVWNNPLKDFKTSKDPELKVLLAVGGQDYAIKRANEMMAKDESRQKFVASTTKLLRTHEFDGLDLNFEPSEALGPPTTPTSQVIEDKKRLSTLCRVRQTAAAAARDTLV